LSPFFSMHMVVAGEPESEVAKVGGGRCNHHVHGEKWRQRRGSRGQREVFEHGKITYVASLVTHQHNCYLFILFYFHIKMSCNAYYLPVRFSLFGSVLLPSFW
jgi:hypothetical protein